MGMMQIVVSEGQSLLDVCLQEAGTLDALFILAAANNLAITDTLAPGQILSLGGLAPNEVARYFGARGVRINTHSQESKGTSETVEGIIMVDFDGAAIVDFDGAYIIVE